MSHLDRARVKQLLERGKDALGHGDHDLARRTLAEAFEAATGDPEVMSSYGLALVLDGVDWMRGVELCEAAVRKAGGATPPALRWNLARAYMGTQYRMQALEALRKLAAVAPNHAGLGAAFESLGVRRKPVVPFLSRSNSLNKYLGFARHRLFPPNANQP